ncbi:hypothetical protein EJ04DRAFT_440740 [Polyplosphaeria fusca]|uniref:Xylanolytic transcriptional activator regulatory domain-containing protein n=1 Tax=Polyplosphaeria fusca TaxID=682080 RepID=A0A9P4QRR4_9PLEO|nr:hypothetical protein EJ04DRAFT_440740 [Polyplosphaeria fusca]
MLTDPSRCFTGKKDCIWAEQARRAKRVRGPSRIAQVERTLNGLVATLTTPDSANEARAPSQVPDPAQLTSPNRAQQANSELWSQPAFPGSWLPFPSSLAEQKAQSEQDVDGSHIFIEKLRLIHSFDDTTDLSRPPAFMHQTPQEPPIDDDLFKDLIATKQADSLLAEYRIMFGSSPYVPIPATASTHELATTKPMLLLAILTAASWREHHRQMALDKLYRTELANRAIIRPRRTVSLVQSIVVYLSWYHFVFSHKTQQTFSLLQLAIGIAIDLTLHQRSRRPFVDFPGRPPQPQLSAGEQRERQRTFLGCYHLSSALSSGLSKPNLLKYTEYMAECWKRLRDDMEYPSDKMIGPLISLRRIDDQIHDAFYTDDALDLSFGDSRIFMNMRFIESQLDDWRSDNTSNKLQRVLDFAYAYAEMQLHSIALRPPSSSGAQHDGSSAQLRSLWSALEAGKRFFDMLLAFPATEYHLLTFSDWMQLPYVVITVARLCMPNENHDAVNWDVKAAQERVRLDLYLESLCYRMQGLSTFDAVKQPHPDFWMVMKMIMELTRKWYCRKINGEKVPPPPVQTNNSSTPETAQSANPGSASTPVSHSAPSMDSATSFPDSSFSAMEIGMAGAGDSSVQDPFAFMRDVNFDMDQFLDMGIWGSGSYEAMGFGGGHMQF